MRWHPDRFMPGPERAWAEARMADINTAYAAFIKGARKRAATGENELNRVKGLIDDGRLSTARELLMTMPTRCAEWNYLFGQLLMKLADYQKAAMYLSVASHQEPENAKYAAACAQIERRLAMKKRRIFGR